MKAILPLALMICALQVAPASAEWLPGNGTVYPATKGLVRPEDGVALPDGRIIVADQPHGLRLINADQTIRPFGRFAAAGYVHAPPAEAAPNGVAFTPDGKHLLVADVFTGAIYRVNIATEATERVYTHPFGVNTAVADSSGAIWFTQSTRNAAGPTSHPRLFEPFNSYSADGALYRLPPPGADGKRGAPRLVLDGLSFANGIAIDEARGEFYLAETNKDQVTAFALSVKHGTLSNPRKLASVMTPDNIELDGEGHLWAASPVQNALVVIDLATGKTDFAFRMQTAAGDQAIETWRQRGLTGLARLDVLTPAVWGTMPGLITGVILTPGKGPFYVSGLGDALVKVERN